MPDGFFEDGIPEEAGGSGDDGGDDGDDGGESGSDEDDFNPADWKKFNDAHLKKLLEGIGTNPHEYKREHGQSKGSDVFRHSKTGEVRISPKGNPGAGESTGHYFYDGGLHETPRGG